METKANRKRKKKREKGGMKKINECEEENKGSMNRKNH